MATPSVLKRSRTGEARGTSIHSREIILLSSDSDSPPPPKRQKSTTPLNTHGFVKTAKPASSVSSENDSTGSQSRATSYSTAKTHHSVQHTQQNFDRRDGPSLLRDSSAIATPHRTSILSNRDERTDESRQSGRFQGPSKSGTPHNPTQPRSTKYATQSRKVDAILPGVTHADEAGVISSYTKQGPPVTTVHKDKKPGSGDRYGSTLLPASRQFLGPGIAYRPSPTPPSTKSKHDTSSPLAPFTLEIPLSKDLAPAHLRPDFLKGRKQMLKDLKKSTEPAEKRLPEVEKYFGQTGFSAAYSTEGLINNRMLKAASKKVREIDRSKIEVDWGEHPDLSPIDGETFDMTSLVHPIEQVKAVLTNRFNENHDPPITFANDINDRRLNGKFQFVNEYIFQPGVKLSALKPEQACSCEGVCYLQSCECLAKEVDKYQSTPVPTYTQSPSGRVVLSDSYILNELDPTSGGFEIVECNEFCGCDATCWNRVVERGRTAPLEIFETAKCGFGVRSSEYFEKGQFIELYLGEVITQLELEQRENAKEEGASSYTFSLDFFKSPAQECYHIDGENFGTAMRFVNHSCNPNARSFTVVRNKSDKNVHYVAFFAVRNIMAGEEICIDYQNMGQVEPEDESEEDGKGDRSEEVSSEVVDDGRARCYCGATNCRKWLWPNKVRKRKKRKTTKHD